MEITIEPDPDPRNGPFHKRITHVVKIPNTKTGHWLGLECGHKVQSFGSLEHAQGRVLCVECRRDDELGV